MPSQSTESTLKHGWSLVALGFPFSCLTCVARQQLLYQLSSILFLNPNELRMLAHMWRASILIVVQPVLSAFLSLVFTNPITFSTWTPAHSFLWILEASCRLHPGWFFFLLAPLALVTYSAASEHVVHKGRVEQELWGQSGCKGDSSPALSPKGMLHMRKIWPILKRLYCHLPQYCHVVSIQIYDNYGWEWRPTVTLGDRGRMEHLTDIWEYCWKL